MIVQWRRGAGVCRVNIDIQSEAVTASSRKASQPAAFSPSSGNAYRVSRRDTMLAWNRSLLNARAGRKHSLDMRMSERRMQGSSRAVDRLRRVSCLCLVADHADADRRSNRHRERLQTRRRITLSMLRARFRHWNRTV